MRFRTQVGHLFVCAVGIGGALSACGADGQKQKHSPAAKPIVARKTIDNPAPIEKVEIKVDAQRSGHSLMVQVTGVGRGHRENGPMEDSDLWQVRASYGQAPLRQVLAGPAKVSRAPTGKALGNQWDVEVTFLVGFALPDRAGKVEIYVQEPGGQTMTHKLEVKAPAERLNLGVRTRALTLPTFR